MANDFKRFTKPNVTTSTGTSADALYTVPSTGGTAMESIIIGIYRSLLKQGRIMEGGAADKRMQELQKRKVRGFNILDWRKNAKK